MELDHDFSEFIASCIAHDVHFLVVGGYAVAAHGHPRFTKDLDVWILVDPTNATRLTEALDSFGFGSLGLSPEDFLEEEIVIQIGYPPKRIDLLTSATGVDFAECWTSRVEIPIGDLSVPFISAEDLLTNKRAAARPQDIADVAALETPSEPDQ